MLWGLVRVSAKSFGSFPKLIEMWVLVSNEAIKTAGSSKQAWIEFSQVRMNGEISTNMHASKVWGLESVDYVNLIPYFI